MGWLTDREWELAEEESLLQRQTYMADPRKAGRGKDLPH